MDLSTLTRKNENQIGLNYLIRNQYPNDWIKDTLERPSIQLNYQNDDGDTALHLAVETCNKEIVELLIHKGASEIRNRFNKKPMDIVEEKLQTSSNENADWETIKLLLKRGEGETSSNVSEINGIQTNSLNTFLDTSGPPPKKRKVHPTGGVRSSLHGIVFQLKLLRLFAQRAIKDNLGPFQMASEMNAAEKFDDIVFKYGAKETRFLQAKHKLEPEKNKITITNLRSTSNKEDFSLQKYFISFCKIKKSKSFENAILNDFIIITNTDFDFRTRLKIDSDELDTWKKLFEEENDFIKDVVLYINNFGSLKPKKHKINMKVSKNLKEFLKINLINTALKSNVIKKNYLSAIKDKLNAIKITHFRNLINEVIKAAIIMRATDIKRKSTKCQILTACSKILELQGKVFDELEETYKKLRKAKQELGKSEKERKETFAELKYNVGAEVKKIYKHVIEEQRNSKEDRCNETIERELNDDLGHLEKIKKEILNSDRLELIEQQCENPILKKNLPNSLYKNTVEKVNSDLEEVQNELKKKLDELISEISVIQVVLRVEEFDSLFDEFFKKFHIITKYPNEEDLGELIDTELSELFSLMPSYLPGAVFDRKLLNFLKYFKKGKAEFITDEDIQQFFNDFKRELKGFMAIGLHALKVKGLREYGIRFKENPDELQKFVDGNSDQASGKMQVFHFITTTPRLSAIKVLHTIETCSQYKTNIQNSYIFTDLKKLLTGHEISTNTLQEPQEIILNAFQMEKSNSLLAIECHGESEGENAKRLDVIRLFADLSKILAANTSKKLILIAKESSDNSESFGKLTVDDSHTDEIFFRDLEETSQTKVLETEVNFPEQFIQLNKLIDVKSADDVFDQMILSEFLEFKMKELKIKIGDKRAFNSIDYAEDFYIGRQFHLGNTANSSLENAGIIRDEKDFCKSESLGQNVIIIANESGMGKSTALTSIARQMKDSLNYLWIVRINLNEIILREFDENNTDDAIKYVTNLIIKGRKNNIFTKFQQNLFRMGLENKCEYGAKRPQIVIMFDAFDEVSRKEIETSTLIKALKMSQAVQIWVSTRDLKKNYLEKRLDSTAYTLLPFSVENQTKFASDWWKWKLKNKESRSGKQFIPKLAKEILKYFEEINLPKEGYADKLRESFIEIKKTQKLRPKKVRLVKVIDNLDFSDYIKRFRNNWKSVENEDNFTSNPLHLRMLTEVIYDRKFELLENFGLFQLFDQFIKLKFFIYYKRKGNVGNNETIEQVCSRDSDHLREIHCAIAVKVLTYNLQLPNLEFKCNDHQEFDKIGLLKLDEENKELSFIHRSYTEFFCSTYLIDNLEDRRVENLAKELVSQEDYKLLRQFFEKNPNKKELKETIFA